MIDKRHARREALHRALGAGNSLKAGIAELVTALEGAVQADRENGIEGALKGATTIAPHRRDHRPGRRAKLAADPGLRALALARPGTTTFEQIADTVAVALPSNAASATQQSTNGGSAIISGQSKPIPDNLRTPDLFRYQTFGNRVSGLCEGTSAVRRVPRSGALPPSWPAANSPPRVFFGKMKSASQLVT